jgi:MFS family permease
MVGLVQFVPTAVLVFAGHAADRYDRKRVVQVFQIVEALTATFLAWGTIGGWLTVPEIFAAVAMLGAAGAFESPASAALLPGVAPEGMLQKATALATGALQAATSRASCRDEIYDVNFFAILQLQVATAFLRICHVPMGFCCSGLDGRRRRKQPCSRGAGQSDHL